MTMNTERVPAQQKSKLYTKPAGPPLCMMKLEYGFSFDTSLRPDKVERRTHFSYPRKKSLLNL